MIAKKLAAKFNRVGASSLGQFVHEAFEENCVLINVHAAPKARRNRLIPHGVIDHQIRNRVTKCVLARIGNALKHHWVATLLLLNDGRTDHCKDRLPRQAHVDTREFFARVEGPGHFAGHDWVVTTLCHVLFSSPDQLDVGTWDLFSDQNGLTGVVLKRATTTKPASQIDLVDITLVGRNTSRCNRCSERSFTILSRHPNVTPIGSPARSRVHRLHRGVILIRVKKLTFNFGSGGGHGRRHVARLITNKRLLRAEAFLQILRDRLTGNLGVRALVPFNSHRLDTRLGLPECIRDDGHRCFADGNDVPYAFHLQGLCSIKRFKLATEDWALPDGGIQHARELKVDPVNPRAIHLVACIQATDSLPDHLPDFGIFQNDFSRHRQLGGRLCD